MKLRPLEALVNGFIMAVGITRPTPEKKRIAKIFIASGLIGSVLGVAALFLFIVTRLS
jgi:hypothetical protein